MASSIASPKSVVRRGKPLNNPLMPYFFLAPFLITFLLFFIAPVLYSVYLSFFIKQRVIGGPAVEVFGGFANYIRAFQDADFLRSFVNIVVFGLIQIPIMLGLATMFALIMDFLKGAMLNFFRTVFYIPYTIPSVIAGLLWGYLYSRNLSPVNFYLESNDKIDFIAGSLLFWSIGNIVTWTWTGYNTIVLYASLQNISRELYEAARVDGATGWNLVRYIKLPLLVPSLLLTFIFSIIGTSQIFSEPFILRSTLGFLPNNTTPNLYLYQVAAQDQNYSYAAALAIILALVTFICSIFFLRQTGRSDG
jgi:multiple sugar transport system permease protein